MLQSKTFSSQFEGEPAPTIKWMRTRADLEAAMTDTETWVSIESAGDDDAGKYTCELNNAAGRTSKSTHVEVVNNEKMFRAYERAKR